jgi:TolB protein
MKSRGCALLLSILVTLLAHPVDAQSDPVHEIYFDTLRTGDVQPTQVAVEDMTFIGNQYITGDDSTLMTWVTRIIRYDVDFYADFSLVEADSFYMKLYEMTEMTLLGWKRLGASFAVRLEAEFPVNNIRVRWRIFDVNNQQRIAGSVEEMPKTQWRNLAHNIANEIVRTLTGEPGIFRTRIVYAREMGDGAKELFMADFDGANERQLTKTGTINLSPCFHPTRDEIYFISYLEGPPQLYKVGIFNAEMEKVAGFPGIVAAPAISPDGRMIACVLSKDGNSEIYVLDLDGRIIKRLTRHPAIETAPTWSPDGRHIAFASDRTGSPQIYIMDSDGLETRRLTFQGRYNDSPIWSVRGDRITFVSRTQHGRFDLASIDTSGLDYRIHTQVGHNENPHFSPDGKHIIFSSNRLGPRDIYAMDLSGRHQRRITRHGQCSNPDWGPIPR